MKLFLGEVATLVLDGQRAIPQELIELDFEFRFPQIIEALQDLQRLKKKGRGRSLALLD